jgi:hypothetical protein
MAVRAGAARAWSCVIFFTPSSMGILAPTVRSRAQYESMWVVAVESVIIVTARAGSRRSWRLSALRAHTKAPQKFDL